MFRMFVKFIIGCFFPVTNYFEKPKYFKELDEISEKIASNQPAISWDDLLDFHFALKQYNINIKRKNTMARNSNNIYRHCKED